MLMVYLRVVSIYIFVNEILNVCFFSRSYKHDLHAARKELEEKWRTQEGMESQKGQLSTRLKVDNIYSLYYIISNTYVVMQLTFFMAVKIIIGWKWLNFINKLKLH